MEKVLLLQTWKTNMGNAFIDIGSEKSLEQAGADVITIGGLQRIIPHLKSLRMKTIQKILQKIPTSRLSKAIGGYWSQKIGESIYTVEKSRKLTYFDFARYIDIDYVCVSGCVLNNYIIDQFGDLLLELKKRNIRIILNGAGGDTYSRFKVEKVKPFLQKLKPDVFISRDPIAFQKYSETANEAYNGIDCGFFVSDAYQPIEIRKRYVVYNFDTIKEPHNVCAFQDIDIVRTHHTPYSIKSKWLKENNFFVSDKPEDYLNVYANAQAIFTDRVHTCVVARAFEKKYKLFYKTIRAKLLERVKNTNLTKEKRMQVKFLKGTT